MARNVIVTGGGTGIGRAQRRRAHNALVQRVPARDRATDSRRAAGRDTSGGVRARPTSSRRGHQRDDALGVVDEP